MKIVYSPQARDDLREIRDYIAHILKNPLAAKNITDKIIKSIHLLSDQPHLGIDVAEKTGRSTDYRCLFSGNYGVFYIPDNDKIEVIRILDLRTDYMRTIFSN